MNMASHGHTKYKPGEIAWGAEHHILPIGVYVKVILALAVLMGLTIWAATWHIGDFKLGSYTVHGTMINNVIAMTIAVIKASLVVLFFMHVKFSTNLTKFWAVIGFVWLSLMSFILADYHSRPLDTSVAEPWSSDPGSATPRDVGGPTSSDLGRHGVNVRPRQ